MAALRPSCRSGAGRRREAQLAGYCREADDEARGVGVLHRFFHGGERMLGAEPRDGRENRPGASQGSRNGVGRVSSYGARGGRPGGRQGHSSVRTGQPRREGSAADRAAGDLLRERGIDPGFEMSRDDLPF